MRPKSVSLAVQLLLTLVGLVVITTIVLTIGAYRSVHASLEDDARRHVRGSADQMARTLTRLIEQHEEFARGFLSSVESLCGETTPSGRTAWELGCAGRALAEFRATERARGALFEYRHRPIAQVGERPRTDLALAPGFARIAPREGGFDYIVTAVAGDSRLTEHFSIEDFGLLLQNHAVLGAQGEIFLTDADGRFLTAPRYGGRSTPPGATIVEPIAECRSGPSESIALDYRGVKTIHGFQRIPLFLGGACVDAHLAYDEALAPADTLLNQLLTLGAAVAFVGVLVALIVSRRIAEPVRRLASSARALEEGDFHRPIRITGPSEIRALARGFVNMARAIADLAEHDIVTDLPNRRLLNDRLRQAIALARRRGTGLAVLFLDLDRFKHVNDSLGHEIGDKLLQSVAGRLRTCLRSSDTVSRHGGDEFVFLLPEVAHTVDAGLSAQKILAAITVPHDVAHHNLDITASIGISVYPDDGEDAETLIKNADTAMYHAKERGRNHYQFFKPEMNAQVVERQWIEGDLRRALDRQEFVLHYQPKMNLVTGEMTGAEALIRWMHPGRGLIRPTQFVPIAEDCGFIVPIGQWVLREACCQAKAWIDAGLRPMAVSINISALEFRDNDFLDNMLTVLKTSGLDPRYLELELTESVLMQRAESAAAVLHTLKDAGVQIAVDDFGTGYSSLSYLRQFPIDILKIDQSFVREITGDPDGAPIVSAIINMGNGLRHRVIAEGVETKGQLAFLQAKGCGEGQGYYFGRPVAATQFASLMAIGSASAN